MKLKPLVMALLMGGIFYGLLGWLYFRGIISFWFIILLSLLGVALVYLVHELYRHLYDEDD